MEANNPNVFPIALGDANVDVFADEAKQKYLGVGHVTGQHIHAKQANPSYMTMTTKIDGINKKPGGKELIEAFLHHTHSLVFGE